MDMMDVDMMDKQKSKKKHKVSIKRRAIAELVKKQSNRRRTQNIKNREKRENVIGLKRQTRRISPISVPEPYLSIPHSFSPLSEPLPASQPFSTREVAEWIANKNKRAPITSIRIGIVIFGHGGLVTEPVAFFHLPRYVNKTFELPRGVLQTNVLGLRYAGLSNIGNQEYEESIDNYLTHRRDDMPKFLRYLENYYRNALKATQYEIREGKETKVYQFRNEIMKNQQIEAQLKTKHITLKGNHFGIREKYDTKRVQKYYTGRIPQRNDPVTHEIIPEENPHSRHRELTLQGPLVKIFNIEINGKNRLPTGYFVLVQPAPYGITLTQIIEQSLRNILPPQLIHEKKTIVDVVDLTCNTTELANPTIEFIGAP